MSGLGRETQLESIHNQLEEWQQNLAVRVAGEAEALDFQLSKLVDGEFDEVWDVLRNAQQQVLAGTDMLRDIRRRLQNRDPMP